MKNYAANDIRNITVVGHASKGKTSLTEAMLYIAGATDRLGKVADSNTVTDYDAEEKKRKISISSAVASIEYKGKKINIIDTPGLFDFAEGAAEGIRAAETAIIVESARSELSVGAEKMYKSASDRNMSKIFVINEMDDAMADFNKTFNSIANKFGTAICPVIVPIVGSDKSVTYYNMVNNKAFKYSNMKPTEVDINPSDDAHFDELQELFNEAIASTDEEIMEKYFGGDELTEADKAKGLSIGIDEGSIIPVFALSALDGSGCSLLLDFIADICPAPKSEYGVYNDEKVELEPDSSGQLAAVCFKTVADPFIGKLSFFKVISGKITQDTPAYNAKTQKSERMGKIVTMFGSKQNETDSIAAGDIGAVVKLSGFETGDTLCSPNYIVTLDGVSTPHPTYSMAISASKKGEEEKISSGLGRLSEEDPSMQFKMDNETHQQLIVGMGEQQIDVAMAKLKAKFSVEAVLSEPKIAYRETITAKVSAHGRHKKQSGGHGQYGEVYIEFEPSSSEKLEFAERVVGGAVPKNFFPAVEKGLNECMEHGVLAGYPMVGVKATLYDGSYHPVDSSEMSFKMAAALAYKDGITNASPVILEPILTVKALCNDEAMGDVIGDINKRRGRVLGMNPAGDGMQEITAEVPSAEMSSFSTAMRQMTQGRGSYESEFARYEKCPENVAQAVIENSKE